MKLTITNDERLNKWMNERRRMGRTLVAIKGDAPAGATYEDGDLILSPVNIAWKDANTGEVYSIEYAQPEEPTNG